MERSNGGGKPLAQPNKEKKTGRVADGEEEEQGAVKARS